ncbi:MAG: tRNA lysidine(34) synthetase TilS, partial [Thermoleophilaceae bacterium]|nr:tRNA lysidine(34) synthetase TilS [Thermoleophilaceae bacterium]
MSTANLLDQAFELPKIPRNGALVMLSGGGDSVALLDIAVTKMGNSRVQALHVNYGLRADAQLEQLHCEQLCGKLGVELHVHRAQLPQSGNLQANARDERYRVANELLAASPGLDVIAVAHTADDQAETVLYRLASSPGRRALRGMAVRSGDLWRPLLGVRRQQLRDHLMSRKLEWREDSSNVDPRFARARVRRMLRDFEDLHPAAVANISATAAQMRLEDDALAAVVRQQLDALRADDGSVAVAELAILHPALAALVLRALAEEAAGELVPLARERLTEVLATTAKGGTRQIDLGLGVTGELAYGRLRVYGRGERITFGSAPQSMHSLALSLPGRISYLGWTLETSAAGDEPSVSGLAPTQDAALHPAASFAIELSVTPAA